MSEKMFELGQKTIKFEQLHEAIRISYNQFCDSEYPEDFSKEDICYELTRIAWDVLDYGDED